MIHEPLLHVTRLRQVQMFGISLDAFEVDGDQRLYLPMRAFCSSLGLSWARQEARLLREDVLSEAVRYVRADPRAASVLCLRLDLLPLWLCGVDVAEVRPDECRRQVAEVQGVCSRRLVRLPGNRGWPSCWTRC